MPSLLAELAHRRAGELSAAERADDDLLAAAFLFQEDYYLGEDPSIADDDLSPLEHFLTVGSDADRRPNPYFQPQWYLAQNPDIRDTGMNPLVHYVLYGDFAGRRPSPAFDTARYRSERGIRDGELALLHYLQSPDARRNTPVAELDSSRVERVNRSRVSGWAFDASRPQMPVRLEIRCDGELVGHLLADQYRADLKAAGWLGEGSCAFNFQWPIALDPFASHIVEVLNARDKSHLPGSPVTLPPAARFDASCRESVTRLLNDVADAAGRGADLDATIAYLVERTDALLTARARLDGGARGAVGNLHDRWGGLVPSAAVRASAPALRPRALFIDDCYPAFAESAGANAALDHMRSLLQLGFEVSFVATQELAGDARPAELLSALGVTPLRAPWYASVEEVLRRHAGRIDLVYLHRGGNAALYGRLARHYCPRALIVYSVADLHHLRVARQGAVENRPELTGIAARLRMDELVAARQADIVITHSPAEATVLRKQLRGVNVAIVPWSVSTRSSPTSFAARRDVAFIGGFAHDPNVDAVYWLAEAILPLVRRADPSIVFRIVGSRIPPAVHQLARPGIDIAGHVESLDTVFDAVRLTVAPLRYGAGLKGKVIESLAAGVPCIGTSIAFEGIAAPASLAGCVADQPAELAAALVRLYRDEAAHAQVAEAGRRYAMEAYDQARIDKLMREVAAPVLRRWSTGAGNRAAG